MNNLKEQAKEIFDLIAGTCINDRAANESTKRLMLYINSLTPQPIKVDAETGEELERPNYGMDGQYDHHYKNYADAPTPLEFIKSQKEKMQIATNQFRSANSLIIKIQSLFEDHIPTDELAQKLTEELEQIKQLQSKVKELEAIIWGAI